MRFQILAFFYQNFSFIVFYDVIKIKTIENNRNTKKIISYYLQIKKTYKQVNVTLLSLSLHQQSEKKRLMAPLRVTGVLLFYCLRTIENNRKTIKTIRY